MRPGFEPRVGKIPCRREWQPTPVFLLGESHGEEPGGLQSMGSQRVGQNSLSNTMNMNERKIWGEGGILQEQGRTRGLECREDAAERKPGCPENGRRQGAEDGVGRARIREGMKASRWGLSLIEGITGIHRKVLRG